MGRHDLAVELKKVSLQWEKASVYALKGAIDRKIRKKVLAMPSDLFAKREPLGDAIDAWVDTYNCGRLDMFSELEDLETEIEIVIEEYKEQLESK